jgi:hypothetical protein
MISPRRRMAGFGGRGFETVNWKGMVEGDGAL